MKQASLRIEYTNDISSVACSSQNTGVEMTDCGTIYYVHGANSKKWESTMFQRLQAEYGDSLCLVEYDWLDPQAAMENVSKGLEEACFNCEEDVIIGNSLGGFLALNDSFDSWRKFVLVNPSLKPWETLKDIRPDHEHEFLRYEDYSVFDFDREAEHRTLIMLILSDNDQLLDSEATKRAMRPFSKIITASDGHSLRNDKSYVVLFNAIKELQNRVNTHAWSTND